MTTAAATKMTAAKRTPGGVKHAYRCGAQDATDANVARIAQLERMLAAQTRDALLVMTDDAKRIAELEAALHGIANGAERAAEGLRYVGPPGHANYLNKTGAADRLDSYVECARAALAKVAP